MNAEPREERVRRILYKGDPSEADYRAACAEAETIRSELAGLRRRLSTLGRTETEFWFDSIAIEAAGTLSLVISGLYTLVNGERSLDARADRVRDLWADAAARPHAYEIREGTHGV